MIKWSDIPPRGATPAQAAHMDQQRIEVVTEAFKATPPAVIVSLSVLGVSLSDVVLLATLVYIVLQAGFLIHRWWRMAHRPNTAAADRADHDGDDEKGHE